MPARASVAQCLLVLSFFVCLGARAVEPGDARVAWGREQVSRALGHAGYTSGAITLDTRIDPASPLLPESARRAEGFALRTTTTAVEVTGFDAAGVLYGCLEVAKRIRDAGELQSDWSTADAPVMELRGPGLLLMKLGTYNYPVTPEEFPFFYDREQWTVWLDFMAEQRFNSLALWNGHPFAYFVKFDRFAEAQSGLPAELIERNRTMLHWLLAEADRRNIRLLFEFYNIHTSVYFQRAHNLPDENRTPTPLLRDYTAYAVETFAREFPEAGYYITPGEALDLEHTDTWVNEVLIPAMKRGGARGPVWLRSWGIDLPHARKVAEANPGVWMERKFNVEMLADMRPDPANRDWAALTGNFVVNLHMAANLEPFRWTSPDYIRQGLLHSVRDGARALHLYPRKSWRWPVGSEPGLPLYQWERDRFWYVAWARYAWNPDRDPTAERIWWESELARHFGDAGAARALLDAQQTAADVLPALQRLIWLGNDNHTVIAAGIRLSQLERAAGIPFLPIDGDVAQRIPEYLETLRQGKVPPAPTPSDSIARQTSKATRASELTVRSAFLARRHKNEAAAWALDAEAVRLVARYYNEKMQAAVLRARAAAPGSTVAKDAFLEPLERSLNTFRELAGLLDPAYDSISDVPAWNPVRLAKVPYHWNDLVPLFERELDLSRLPFTNSGPPPSNKPELPGLVGLLYGDAGLKRVVAADPITTLDLNWSDSDRGRHWSSEWRGFIVWPRDGRITLRVRSDNSVRLQARGEPLPAGTGLPESREIAITARKGEAVPVWLVYDHTDGSNPYLEVRWDAQPGVFSPVPPAALLHSHENEQWADSTLLMGQL